MFILSVLLQTIPKPTRYLINDHCLISIYYQQLLLKNYFLLKSKEFSHTQFTFFRVLERKPFIAGNNVKTY